MATAPILIGHRGSCARSPENTLRSFRSAVEEGAQVVELDLRLSADGIPVVFHDADLRRLAGRPERAEEMTARQLGGLPVLREEHEPGDDTTIPTLDTVLQEIGTRARLYLELKQDGGDDAHNDGLLAAVLERIGTGTPHLVASFSARLVAAALAAGAPAAIILDRPGDLDALAPDAAAGLQAWSLRHSTMDQAFATRAATAGVPVWGWTVDDEAALDRLLERGVQGICSNDVARMQRWLRRRFPGQAPLPG